MSAAIIGSVFYISTDLPPIPTLKQASIIYYADGRTELARLTTENREEVPLREVPLPLRHAVMAAEDVSFAGNIGISLRGTTRAAWGLAAGKDLGGGSTITQQYIRNAFDLTRDASLSRKAKEIVLAIKATQKYTKDEIFERYLNTIYFGRGSWGIQAAARAYFDKPVSELTVAEGIVLAAVIKDPTHLDPANDLRNARARWDHIASAMRHHGSMTHEELTALDYPTTVIPQESNVSRQGSNGILVYQIEQAMEALGYSPQQLYTGGLRIVTSIELGLQNSVVDTTRRTMKDQPVDRAVAVVLFSSDGKKILAYYGGERNYGEYDFAAAAGLPDLVSTTPTPKNRAAAFIQKVAAPMSSLQGHHQQMSLARRSMTPIGNPMSPRAIQTVGEPPEETTGNGTHVFPSALGVKLSIWAGRQKLETPLSPQKTEKTPLDDSQLVAKLRKALLGSTFAPSTAGDSQ